MRCLGKARGQDLGVEVEGMGARFGASVVGVARVRS